MCLVDSIVEEIEGGLVCKVVIDDAFVFLRDGEVDGAVCIELVAQSIGCMAGLHDLRQGRKPRPGLLVGCRQARFDGRRLRRGDELRVTVERQWVREPAASFLGKVERDDAVLASMELCVVAVDGDIQEALGSYQDA
jgi:predicted hotdog family 3-hydroxylacyl-ACP dehydratase